MTLSNSTLRRRRRGILAAERTSGRARVLQCSHEQPIDRCGRAGRAPRRARLGRRRLPLHADGPSRGTRRVRPLAHPGRALRGPRPRPVAPAGPRRRAPSPRPARFVARRVGAEQVVATADLPTLQADGALLVDARAAVRYRGEQEPIDPVAGHVPGAVNRPGSANLGPDGRFRSPAELAREIGDLLGGRPPGALIAMCGSGVNACQLLLALEVAALSGARLYAGSWSEWIRDPARPIR